MNTVGYIKSFSKGQITIPKEVRKALGIGDTFWLRLTIDNGRIVAEPVREKISDTSYLQTLTSIKGSWIVPEELENNRKAIEKRMLSSAKS